MKQPRRDEAGFALLLVFAMAASIAIMLYTQLPRAAFEAQREREERLVRIGNEYRRAIQLQFRKTRKLPQDMDQLEKAGNIRYLRRRYPDPMTGRDDWRIIHMDNLGQLTDSVTTKAKDDKGGSTPNSFITEAPHIGQQPTTSQGGNPNPALRVRPSERQGYPWVAGGMVSNAPGDPQNPANPNYGQPGYYPGPSQGVNPQGYPVGVYPGANPQGYPLGSGPQGYPVGSGLPGSNMPVGYPVGSGLPGSNMPVGYPVGSGLPGQNMPAGYPVGSGVPGGNMPSNYPLGSGVPGGTMPPGYPVGSGIPGMPAGRVYPGGVSNSQTGGTAGGISVQPGLGGGAGYPGNPGYPGATPGYPGASSYNPNAGVGATSPTYPGQGGGQGRGFSSGGNTGATAMIQNILQTPRPGGAPQGMGAGAMMMTGGIAGIASKYEAEGIKIVNDRTSIHEWEFIYDPKKDTGGAQAAGMQAQGGPVPEQGGLGQGTNQSGFGSTGSSFGNSGSSFGNSGSSFGNSVSSFGNSGSSFGGNRQR